MGVRSERHAGVRRAALTLLAAAVLPGCSAGAPEQPAELPAGLEGVVQFQDLSPEHVEEPVEYEQVPPVGGPHLPPPRG